VESNESRRLLCACDVGRPGEETSVFMPRNSREILLKEQKKIFDLEDGGSAFIGNIIALKIKDAISLHQRLESA
jgi:hypothetical protein